MITLQVFPTYPDGITAQWEISNSQLPGDYWYKVYLLVGSSVVQESVNLPNCNTNTFRIPIESYHIPYTVKVVCTPPQIDKLKGWVVEEAVQPINHELDSYELAIAAEIVRKENLLFERKIGRRCKIFKRRYIGPVCTACVDPKTDTIINSQCPICYGTKYGFYDPIQLWMDIVEQPIDKAISDIGTTEDKKSNIRLTNRILISKHDIIYDEITKVKWEVAAEPQIIRYRSFPVSQLAPCFAVSAKSIFNKLGT